MNVGEYGVVFAFDASFDMSAKTSLSLALTKPDGTVLTKTPTLGTIPLVTTLGTFAANEYVTYTFINGDVNQAGIWCAQLTYNDASQHLISDFGHFTVDEPEC